MTDHDEGETNGDLEAMLERLDRLESLREDMDELGIVSLAELNTRIQELHDRIDQMEEETPER